MGQEFFFSSLRGRCFFARSNLCITVDRVSLLWGKLVPPLIFSNRLAGAQPLPERSSLLLLTYHSLLYYLSTPTTPPNAFIFSVHTLPIWNCWNSLTEPGVYVSCPSDVLKVTVNVSEDVPRRWSLL